MVRKTNLAPNEKRREVEQCMEDSLEGQDWRRREFKARMIASDLLENKILFELTFKV